jgi:hypothetical protein
MLTATPMEKFKDFDKIVCYDSSKPIEVLRTHDVFLVENSTRKSFQIDVEEELETALMGLKQISSESKFQSFCLNEHMILVLAKGVEMLDHPVKSVKLLTEYLFSQSLAFQSCLLCVCIESEDILELKPGSQKQQRFLEFQFKLSLALNLKGTILPTQIVYPLDNTQLLTYILENKPQFRDSQEEICHPNAVLHDQINFVASIPCMNAILSAQVLSQVPLREFLSKSSVRSAVLCDDSERLKELNIFLKRN